MRLQTLFGLLVGFVGFSQCVYAAEEPQVLAVASFPEANAFGQVVNGERNKLFLTVENNSDRNITITNIAGSFHHPDSNALVKNTSALAYGTVLLEGAKLQLPYTFYSEFKPGDLRLNLWVEHNTDGETYRVTAYDSVVTIVEPEMSWFDLKMWSTYLVVSALLGGLGYYAYLTFAPQPKRKTRPAPSVSAPVGTVTATGAGGYQEEWIPAHHLKKSKAKRTVSGALTSGDETSGPEPSVTEDRKRKGKK
ncbi:hypothetical protein B0H21DRAFT_570609 [Amylocystis lapponica]|nr:hypothetical protein B0H21DRAFT_570609 [Amylocystis lapponica]